MERNTLSKLLTSARGDRSMRGLARESGLSVAQISRIESGDVAQPSVETLSRLAAALDRDPQTLLIAAGRIALSEATVVVRSLLDAIPAGTSGDLAGALHALTEQEAAVKELEVAGVMLDGEAAAKLEVADSWRNEYDVAFQEANHFAVAMIEDDHDSDLVEAHRRQAEAASGRCEMARTELEGAERDLVELRARTREHEERLDAERERLDAMVRDYAARLFVRGGAHSMPALPYLLIDEAFLGPGGTGRSDRLATLLTTRWLSQCKLTHGDDDHVDAWPELRGLEGLLQEARNRLIHQPEDSEFRQLARAWPRLTPERRARVLQFVEDQRLLSVQEELQKTRAEEVPAIAKAKPKRKKGS